MIAPPASTKNSRDTSIGDEQIVVLRYILPNLVSRSNRCIWLYYHTSTDTVEAPRLLGTKRRQASGHDWTEEHTNYIHQRKDTQPL